MEFKNYRVLLVEDDEDYGNALRYALQEKFGMTVDIANYPYQALLKMYDNSYNVVILDWSLPHMDGGETISKMESVFALDLNTTGPGFQNQFDVIVLSSHPKEKISFQSTKNFQYLGYVSKVQRLDDTLAALKKILKQQSAGKKPRH